MLLKKNARNDRGGGFLQRRPDLRVRTRQTRGRELLMFANACVAMAAQRVGGAQTVPSLSDIAEFQKTAKA